MPRYPRHVLQLLLLALLALAAAPALAAPRPQPSGVTLAARPAYEAPFRAGTWLPITVSLENTGRDRVVQVRVGSREGAQYAATVELPNGGRKAVTLYAFMTPASRRLVVRLLDGDQELASETLTLAPANQQARTIGLLTAQGVTIRPPARLADGRPLVAVPLGAADLPEHHLGLSGLSALVIEGVAPSDLRPAQRDALAEWVARGGLLILGGGDALATTLAGLPAPLRPAAVDTVAPVPSGSLLGPDAPAGDVPVATLSPRPDLVGRPPYLVPLTPVTGAAVEQSFGRGAVLVVPFPLGHPALLAWEGAPDLWAALLRPAFELPPGFAPDNMSLDSFIEGNMASTLTSLPALKFPPMGLLVGMLIAYIVLVGPVTYLVLRRLDRQALGWVVVPAITLLFAGLTYSLGYAQRGGDIVFNQVTLLELLDGAPERARARTFVGVFSPERRSYTLQLAGPDTADPTPLLRPISIQGPWDNASPSGGGVFLQEGAAGAQAGSFEVAQWSLRAVTSDSSVALPGLRSTLRLDGSTLVAEVANHGELPLKDVTVLQGDRVARLGDLAPGETRSSELRRRAGQGQPGGAFSMPVSYLIYGEELDKQGRSDGQPLSPELQQRVRLLDALFNYGPSLRGGHPLLVAWSDAPALAVTSDVERADRQGVTLITATPSLALPSGPLTLGQGWLAPRFERGMASVCFGGPGAGLTLGPEPASMQLTLPRDLYGLRPSELRLLTSSDGPWQDATQVELYDWASGAWVAQAVTARDIIVPEPERYLASHGMIRVRLTNGPGQPNFNCVYVDAKLTGSLS